MEFDWRTEDNLRLVEEFKNRDDIAPYIKEYYSDDYIYRWLKAKNFNLKKVVPYFIEAMKWREENEIETLVERVENEDFIVNMTREGPVTMSGDFHCKDGWPVYYRRVVDTKYLLKKYGEEDFTTWHLYMQEKNERYNRHLVEERGYSRPAIWIIDIGDITLKHVDGKVKHAFQRVSKLFDKYYPETAYKFYVVNAPGIFAVIWNIVKGIIDKNTARKVNIISENGRKELLEFMHEEDLATFCGGELVGIAGDLSGLVEFDETSEPQMVEIAPESVYEHPFVIEEDGISVLWKVKVVSYDIHLSIVGEDGTIHELGRHKETEGHMPLTKGTYTFIFDNTYSQLHPKSTTYTITTVETIEE
eukprot:TRINITY_DN3914_c0_g1_i2.p1 TRINITY_DN3914_c0_g1~~TRINITY_DN3914_c0_g1_i2.p1  ORF type:complete len:360 (-),score=84.27 TRINITY_DN3914_c0_g1_i2:32-1111(-)